MLLIKREKFSATVSSAVLSPPFLSSGTPAQGSSLQGLGNFWGGVGWRSHLLCLLRSRDSERWNLSGWDVRLFLSSFMVIVPFLAFFFLQVMLWSWFLWNFSLPFLLWFVWGRNTERLQLPGKPCSVEFANHRTDGLWDPSFSQLHHSGILLAVCGWMQSLLAFASSFSS